MVWLLILAFLAAAPGAIPQAGAVTYGFARITSNSSQNVASQLQVEVTDPGSNKVMFHFTNDAGGIASSITAIYFDDGALLAIAEIVNGPEWDKTSKSGVSFSQGATPANLPGGKNLSPAFKTTAGFSADADNPGPFKGVNPGEYVDIIFNLQTGKIFADVIAALSLGITNPAAAGSLRLGLHVQSIGTDGNSDSFIAVPLPGSVLLLGTGLLGLAFPGFRRRRRP